MNRMDFEGQWVLVTGASSGLGREMARVLAAEHRAHLLLVARRVERLETLACELSSRHGIEAKVIPGDLSRLDEVDRVLELAVSGRQLHGAILNAGVTHFGPFEELPWEQFESMLHTNVTSVVRMANALIPHLEKHPFGGGLMLVSSMAGLTPVPFQTAYSATKAFLIHYGHGLSHELEGRNVSVTTYAPAGIATEMTSGENFKPLADWLMDAGRAAREGVVALQQRKRLHVPGAANKLGALACRVLPHDLVTGKIASTYRRALEASGGLRRRQE